MRGMNEWNYRSGCFAMVALSLPFHYAVYAAMYHIPSTGTTVQKSYSSHDRANNKKNACMAEKGGLN